VLAVYAFWLSRAYSRTAWKISLRGIFDMISHPHTTNYHFDKRKEIVGSSKVPDEL
jgi:hypothetical protein